VNLEQKNMTGWTAFMRPKQSTSKGGSPQKALLVKRFLPKPKSFDDLETLTSHVIKTMDDQPFLVLNDTVITRDPMPGAKWLLVYTSQSRLDVLASCVSWYVDSAFKLAISTLFTQLNQF
jgi:hypothetical protein